MTILLAVFTDGRRECIAETIPSALANLQGLNGPRLIFDDSGDPSFASWLQARFTSEGFTVLSHSHRLGFGGSIRAAWSLLSLASAEFVFHLEDDFTFNRPVDVAGMSAVLSLHPHLVQLALRRQPWNDEERRAGGIVEQHPDDFVERSIPAGLTWLEHRRFFTTNPSLYRRSLCERGWPEVEHSEGHFGIELFKDGGARSGFWGGLASGEAVTHIGRERVGTGY